MPFLIALERQSLQQQCHDQIRRIYLILDNNRIKSNNLFLCEKPEMLPNMLSRISRMRSSLDMLFFVLGENASCMEHAVVR